MPIAPPENPTQENIKAVARFILQQSYDDGISDLTIERSDGGFTGQFVDRTDPKKVFEYEITRGGDGWEIGYEPISGVEGGDGAATFAECAVAPIWNPAPFDFESFDFAESIRVGTTVSWKWQSGTATGKVVKLWRDRVTLKLDGTSVTRNGTQDNPAILIEQESGARALKLASEVSVGAAAFAEAEQEELDEVAAAPAVARQENGDPADYYSQQAFAQAAPIFDGWLNTLESQLFDGAATLEEVRDRVESAYSDLDASDFAELMQNLLLSGYGAGRYQVRQEAAEDAALLSSATRQSPAQEFDAANIAQDSSAFAASEDALEYATKKSTSGTKKQKTCSKGYSCGFSCVAKTKSCASPLPGQAKNYADWLSNQIAAGAKLSPTQAADAQAQGLLSPPPAPPATPSAPSPTRRASTEDTSATQSLIKTNQTELDKKRADLVKRVGQRQVEDAEKNVQRILNSADTNVFIRVGKSETLEKILGDRFRTSAELGVTDHQIPHLLDDYQTARNRVEAKTLGYDKTTKPDERPIYGYLGGNDLDGASHANVTTAYGSIALKMKPAVKDRATFTGADSFKSGIASEVANAGTPPPPNAASLVSTTRHGYDREKLPGHYPSYYSDNSSDGGQLRAAKNAKNIDDLVPTLATTGNAYMEAQIHGKVKPQDIAEIHFSPTSVTDRPNAAIASFAKDNSVLLFVNGRKLSDSDLDNIINPQTKRNRANDLSDALDRGDIDTVVKIADQIHTDSRKLKMGIFESDSYLKQLYQDTGFDGLPVVGTEQDVTKAWKDGGTLMTRGVATGMTDRLEYLKQFQTGDYYVGSGIYGNGTYVGHAGNIVNGKFVGYNAKTEKQDAKRAFDDVAKHNYITPRNVTFRMALRSDAVVVTQTELLKQRDATDTKLEAWAKKERAKLMAQGKRITTADVTNYNNTLSQIRSDYSDAPQVKVKKKTGIPGGATITEVQTWEYTASSGKPIKATVEVSNYGGSNIYYLMDDRGSMLLTHRSASKGSNSSAAKEFFDHLTEREALSKLKLDKPPKAGMLALDDQAKKDLAKFEARYERTRAVLGIEDKSDQQGAIGRFAAIRGVDAVALDQSYEPNTFMNLLNRSKVIIQKDELLYSKGKKTGAL